MHEADEAVATAKQESTENSGENAESNGLPTEENVKTNNDAADTPVKVSENNEGGEKPPENPTDSVEKTEKKQNEKKKENKQRQQSVPARRNRDRAPERPPRAPSSPSVAAPARPVARRSIDQSFFERLSRPKVAFTEKKTNSQPQSLSSMSKKSKSLPRSLSNIDRLAAPRCDHKHNRSGHKHCLISIFANELFRDPFNYRRARSASRPRTSKRKRDPSAAKRPDCCEHCAESRLYHCIQHCRRGLPTHRCCEHCKAPQHCLRTTCGQKALHFCCAHCQSATRHCNDGLCECVDYTHRCCSHCDSQKQVHCAAGTCAHSRVHKCCAHCAEATAVLHSESPTPADESSTGTTRAAHQCTRRECLHSNLHRCCSHCNESNSLHCLIRACIRAPQLRLATSVPSKQKSVEIDNSTVKGRKEAQADLPKAQSTAKVKPKSKSLPRSDAASPGPPRAKNAQKLKSEDKQKPSRKVDAPVERKITERKGLSSTADLSASKPNHASQSNSKPLAVKNSTDSQRITAKTTRDATATPRSAKSSEVPAQAKKPAAKRPEKIQSAKTTNSTMVKSMIVQSTTTISNAKKIDRMVTSTTTLNLKKQPEPAKTKQVNEEKVIRVKRPPPKAPDPPPARSRNSSSTMAPETKSVEGTIKTSTHVSHTEITTLNVTRSEESTNMTMSMNEKLFSPTKSDSGTKPESPDSSKTEKNVTKFDEERIERKRRVETILKRVKNSPSIQRSDSAIDDPASGASTSPNVSEKEDPRFDAKPPDQEVTNGTNNAGGASTNDESHSATEVQANHTTNGPAPPDVTMDTAVSGSPLKSAEPEAVAVTDSSEKHQAGTDDSF